MNARLILMTSCLLAALCLTKKADAAGGSGWAGVPWLPEPNDGFACGVSHGQIVVVGGTNWEGGEKHWLSAVHLYNPKKQLWTTPFTLDAPMAYGVGGSSASMPGWDRIISPEKPDGAKPAQPLKPVSDTFGCAGGTTGTTGHGAQFWVLGPGHIGTRPGLPTNAAVVLAAGGLIGERLIFVGGTDKSDNIAGMTTRVIALDLNGKTEKLPDYPGKPFGIAGSAVMGDRLYVFGGATWDAASQAPVNLDDAYVFLAGEKKWTKLKALPFAVRGMAAVAVSDHQIYLAGGYKNDQEEFTDEAFLYDTAKDDYAPAKKLPYKAMLALVNCDGFVYCLGGEDKKKSRTAACFRIAVGDLLK